uniref:hAT-like transposase RNase-H fold domain-containing protein n=1 Tax=Lactuca sativa TaxID=4236 RepID=A0A9R1VTQ4_LACSA|nr:hypothetical protein LSAT_V11C400214840 [Lactuca sativa]
MAYKRRSFHVVTPLPDGTLLSRCRSLHMLQEAFMEFGVRDKSYERDLNRVLENYDFEFVTEMVTFFEKFKKKTEVVWAASKPLVNLFIREVLDVNIHLRNWSTKPMFLEMVKDMKTKYNKYWVLLDPTTKSHFLLHAFKKMIGYMEVMEPSLTLTDIDKKARQMVRKIENRMDNLFMNYLKRFDNSGSSQQEASQKVIDVDDDIDFFDDFLCTGGSNSDATDNGFQAYLKENIVTYKKIFKSQVVETKRD